MSFKSFLIEESNFPKSDVELSKFIDEVEQNYGETMDSLPIEPNSIVSALAFYKKAGFDAATTAEKLYDIISNKDERYKLVLINHDAIIKHKTGKFPGKMYKIVVRWMDENK